MTTAVRRRTVPLATVQGTLALDLGPAARPQRGPDLRLVPGGRADLDAFAHRFASALVEVMGGDRGPQQLLRWTSPEVYDALLRRSAALSRTVPADRRVRRLRSQVRSVHVYCPAPGSAEISIHVRQGHRSRALAVRLDLLEGRWCCTALELG